MNLNSSPLALRRSRPGGSSLLLVLWAIMLMSFAVIGLISHLSRGLDESIYAEKEFRARLLLQSARTLQLRLLVAQQRSHRAAEALGALELCREQRLRARPDGQMKGAAGEWAIEVNRPTLR